MDAEQIIMQIRERDAEIYGAVHRCSCGSRILVWGRDCDGNDLYDALCPDCQSKEIQATLRLRQFVARDQRPRRSEFGTEGLYKTVKHFWILERRARQLRENQVDRCSHCFDQPPIKGLRWCSACRRRNQDANIRELMAKPNLLVWEEESVRNYKNLDLSPEVVTEVEAFLKSLLPF